MDQASGPQAQALEDLLKALWKSNHPIILDRVRILREASEKLTTGSLDAVTRKAANSAAHKLSGVLGTFGLPEGSRLASQIEWQFDENSRLGAKEVKELGSLIDKLEAVIASKNL